jgi:hypothetical protein
LKIVKISLILIIFIVSIALAKPPGVYRDFEQYQNSKPALPDTFSVKEIETKAITGSSYYKIFKLDNQTGREIRWNRLRNGKIWLYITDEKLYINYLGYISLVNYNGSIGYFKTVIESVDVDGGGEVSYSEVLAIVDFENGKTSVLTSRKLKKILKKSPVIYSEYKNSKNRYSKSELFLEKFVDEGSD